MGQKYLQVIPTHSHVPASTWKPLPNPSTMPSPKTFFIHAMPADINKYVHQRMSKVLPGLSRHEKCKLDAFPMN